MDIGSLTSSFSPNYFPAITTVAKGVALGALGALTGSYLLRRDELRLHSQLIEGLRLEYEKTPRYGPRNYPDEALEAFKEAAEGGSPLAKFFYARALKKADRVDEAMPLFKEAGATYRYALMKFYKLADEARVKADAKEGIPEARFQFHKLPWDGRDKGQETFDGLMALAKQGFPGARWAAYDLGCSLAGERAEADAQQGIPEAMAVYGGAKGNVGMLVEAASAGDAYVRHRCFRQLDYHRDLGKEAIREAAHHGVWEAIEFSDFGRGKTAVLALEAAKLGNRRAQAFVAKAIDQHRENLDELGEGNATAEAAVWKFRALQAKVSGKERAVEWKLPRMRVTAVALFALGIVAGRYLPARRELRLLAAAGCVVAGGLEARRGLSRREVEALLRRCLKLGLEGNRLEELLLYKQLAEQGNPYFQALWAEECGSGEEEAEWYRKAMSRGLAFAGAKYYESLDDAQLMEAAEQGIPEAQYQQGKRPGSGDASVEWFRKASEQGHRGARTEFYWGLEEESSELGQALDRGDPDAQFVVGCRGDDQALLKAAADQGHPEARMDYYRSLGDDELKEAADGGVPEAQYAWGMSQASEEDRMRYVRMAAQAGLKDALEWYVGLLESNSERDTAAIAELWAKARMSQLSS
jgi:hypothetical protein